MIKNQQWRVEYINYIHFLTVRLSTRESNISEGFLFTVGGGSFCLADQGPPSLGRIAIRQRCQKLPQGSAPPYNSDCVGEIFE